MTNVTRMVELGLVPPVAREVARQFAAGAGNANALMERSVVAALAVELAKQAAGTKSARRLIELGMPSDLAAEIAGAGSGPPVPTQLPQQSAIVARFRASDITGLANMARIPSWTSGVGTDVASQATVSRQPRYLTDDGNGRPCVLFEGGEWLNLVANGPASQAMQNRNYTVIVIASGVQPSQFGRFWCCSNDNSTPALIANGTDAGSFNASGRVPFSDASLVMLGLSVSPTVGDTRANINGTMAQYDVGLGAAPSGAIPSIGGADFYDVSAIGKVYEVIVYANTFLRQWQFNQATMYAYDQAKLAYPWAGVPFRAFYGNSLWCNYNEGNGGTVTVGSDKSVPMRVAALKGWKAGQYTNLSIVGRNQNQLDQDAVLETDPLATLAGFGSDVHIIGHEYTNQATLPSAQSIANTRNFNKNRKSAGAKKVYTVNAVDLANDVSGYDPAQRANYNAEPFVYAGEADVLIDVSKDPIIGVETAVPNSGNRGPNWSGQIHCADPGYTRKAQLTAAGLP